MIRIKRKVLDDIVVHAQQDLPDEACGYLSGTGGMITGNYRLTNIDHSPEHFSFDPAEQFDTLRDTRKKGLVIIANYHSHPASAARPSKEDISLAFDPGISYVIVSLAGKVRDIRSFRIINGIAEQEEIVITD
jgi:proteasome lid subunit RPN8/RPN11